MLHPGRNVWIVCLALGIHCGAGVTVGRTHSIPSAQLVVPAPWSGASSSTSSSRLPCVVSEGVGRTILPALGVKKDLSGSVGCEFGSSRFRDLSRSIDRHIVAPAQCAGLTLQTASVRLQI